MQSKEANVCHLPTAIRYIQILSQTQHCNNIWMTGSGNVIVHGSYILPLALSMNTTSNLMGLRVLVQFQWTFYWLMLYNTEKLCQNNNNAIVAWDCQGSFSSSCPKTTSLHLMTELHYDHRFRYDTIIIVILRLCPSSWLLCFANIMINQLITF